MKIKITTKSAHSLKINEKTPIHRVGDFKGVAIVRTKKGYHAEVPGFKRVTVEKLEHLKPKEINRVRTR